MKKVEIRITDYQTGNVETLDVSQFLQPVEMSMEDSYRYHTLCARQTLYPGKTWEEVQEIINEGLRRMEENQQNSNSEENNDKTRNDVMFSVWNYIKDEPERLLELQKIGNEHLELLFDDGSICNYNDVYPFAEIVAWREVRKKY